MTGSKIEKLAGSNASRKVQGELMTYIQYYRKAKGTPPSVIRLSPEQLKRLGVKSGYNFNGTKLELKL